MNKPEVIMRQQLKNIMEKSTTFIKDVIYSFMKPAVHNSPEPIVQPTVPTIEEKKQAIIIKPVPVPTVPVMVPEAEPTAFSAYVPSEVLSLILSKLPLSAMATLPTVSKSFNDTAQDHNLWAIHAAENNMPTTFGTPEKSLKEKLADFLKEVDHIEENYGEHIKTTFGGAKKIAALPILNGHDLNIENFKNRTAVRGTMTAHNTPFVALCSNLINDGPTITSIAQPKNSISIIFTVKTNNLGSSGQMLLYPTKPIVKTKCDYLGRLFRGEPCGRFHLLWEQNEGPKVDENGKSVVRLMP